MAFWNRKPKESESELSATGRPKEEDMAKKKSEDKPEPVITSAPRVESDETPVERPVRKAKSDPLAELFDQLTVCAAQCRAAASTQSGVGAHVLSVQAETYDAAAAMVKEKMS